MNFYRILKKRYGYFQAQKDFLKNKKKYFHLILIFCFFISKLLNDLLNKIFNKSVIRKSKISDLIYEEFNQTFEK